MSVRTPTADPTAFESTALPASEGNIALTRVLNVDICTNLADICLNSDAGLWAPTEEALGKIFRPTQYVDLQGTTATAGDLTSCAVSRVELLHMSHNFPCPVGVDMPIVPATSYNAHGECSSLIVPPHAKMEKTTLLHECNQDNVFEFAKLYPGYTRGNVRTKGVHPIPSKGFALVDCTSPIVAAIQSNRDLLQLNEHSLVPGEDGLVRVSSELLNHVLPHVTQQISAQVRTEDLSTMRVQIKPGAARNWNDVRISALSNVRAEIGANRRMALRNAPEADHEAINAKFDNMLSEAEIKLDHCPRDVNMSIKLTYNFLDQEAATSAC
jgi:hypothetical protein